MTLPQIFTIALIAILLNGCKDRTIDDALASDELIRWKKEQKISFDMFLGTGPDNAYSAYVGYYFIYDLKDAPNIRFNVTTFLDRTKSYASDVNEMTDSTKHAMFPQLYKLKFDHFEIYARKFRKYLVENGSTFNRESEDQLRPITEKFLNQADSAWTVIMNDIEVNNDYTQEHFRYLRDIIDMDLAENIEYDDSRNNFDKNFSH
jgi:hypothetical protein